jgi:hypothetical protein
MGSIDAEELHGGLGNQTLLAKIDKLRELNVGTIVPLPQVSATYCLSTSLAPTS